jgi:hypothetical protein
MVALSAAILEMWLHCCTVALLRHGNIVVPAFVLSDPGHDTTHYGIHLQLVFYYDFHLYN